MNDEKWYYRLTNLETDDELYVAVNVPVKEDKVLDLLPDVFEGWTTKEISKEEYEENTDDDESA